MPKEFVEIIRDEDEKQEYVADVENKSRQNLGKIYYKSNWRKFVFEVEGVTFDTKCLSEIANHLNWLDICKKDGTLKEQIKN